MNTVRKTTMPNGLRVLTEVVEEVYSASIGIWIDVGSEDETDANNGASHALEHMLFKGTEKRTGEQIAQEIEDVGGSLGAATGKENTGYYGRVLGNKLGVAIDLLADMIMHPTLSEEDLELERQVILEEIKMYEDDPEDLVHETLVLHMWPNHPLSRPITGTEESVMKLTPAILKKHVQDFYRPENIVVSIAGNFNEDKAIEKLKQTLGTMRGGEPKPEIPAPKFDSFIMVKDKDIEQAHIALSTRGLQVTSEKRYQLAILDLCLGGNMSSRLFQEVREKRGLVYTINTFRDTHRKTGLFGVYAACSPHQVDSVLQLIMTEFSRVKEEGFVEAEIKRAKTQLTSELLLGLESMRNRISRNVYGELFWGRQMPVEEIVADIEKVKTEDLTLLANDLLRTQDLSLVVVGPSSELKRGYSLVC